MVLSWKYSNLYFSSLKSTCSNTDWNNLVHCVLLYISTCFWYLPEPEHATRDDHGEFLRQERASSAGSSDAVPQAAAAPDPHHGVLVPVAVLRGLREEALLPAVQLALSGTVVGKCGLVALPTIIPVT